MRARKGGKTGSLWLTHVMLPEPRISAFLQSFKPRRQLRLIAMLPKGASVCARTTLRGECGFCGKALRTRVFQTRGARVQGQPLQVLSASAWPRRRMFSTTSASRSSSDSPIKVSYLLGALLVFGIGTTSWGLYVIHFSSRLYVLTPFF